MDPLNIASAISRTVTALKAKGMPASTPVFLMGHSLGGAMLELYAYSNPAGYVYSPSSLVSPPPSSSSIYPTMHLDSRAKR